MRASKKVTIVGAGLLSIVLTAGMAFAVTGHQPTITLEANRNHRTIVARGYYDPVSPICHGPGGRSVILYGNQQVIGTGGSKASGRYVVKTGRLKKGTYDVQSFVHGTVRSGYGETDVCYDAWSNAVTVQVGKSNPT